MSNGRRLTSTVRLLAALGLAASGSIWLGGCNEAQAGSLLGAGVGALAGQAIGGDTGATLLGTGIGAGAGYIVGNEVEKSRVACGDVYGPRWYRRSPCEE